MLLIQHFLSNSGRQVLVGLLGYAKLLVREALIVVFFILTTKLNVATIEKF